MRPPRVPCICVLSAMFVCSRAVAFDRLDELLAKLSARPIDESTLLSIERQRTDPRIRASLSRAFESSTSKREKQWIALTLTHLDAHADNYVAFLTEPAKDAIEDQAPYFAAYDGSGRQIRGQFSPIFQNWCAQNGKDPRAMAALQTYDEPEDVLMLARANAPQSRDLLRKGLNSSNPL